jgi:small subunit ribosomal protein S20
LRLFEGGEYVANHPQAKKRARQRIKITARNRHVRSTVRTFLKSVANAVAAGEKDKAVAALGAAVRQLDKAVTKGVLPRKTASRKISRLTVAVNKL